MVLTDVTADAYCGSDGSTLWAFVFVNNTVSLCVHEFAVGPTYMLRVDGDISINLHAKSGW